MNQIVNVGGLESFFGDKFCIAAGVYTVACGCVAGKVCYANYIVFDVSAGMPRAVEGCMDSLRNRVETSTFISANVLSFQI